MAERAKKIFFVVDDDEDITLLVSRYLEKAVPGIQVACFTDARHCAQRLETSDQPTMLITDLNMFPMDGFHLIKWIRSRPTMTFPLVVFSGSSIERDREQCSRLGADAFVPKGSGCCELTKCVRGLLESSMAEVT